MTTEEKMKIVREVGEEIIGEDEIAKRFNEGKEVIAYDGFEPSGKIHIAQGLLRAINIQKLLSTGIKFKMLVADWHAYANNKLGGDLEKIKTTGKYFIEVWKACGLDTDKVEFVWASDLVKDPNYWLTVLKVARTTTIKRMIRCSQIMGREESDNLTVAQLIYPAMQASDIFYLGVNMAQLGMDQRKVNMLARQIAPELGFEKPVAVHHHMLMGLKAPGESSKEMDKLDKTVAIKMSKSHPDSAIFMADSETEVTDKIRKAFCPPQIVEENPIIEYFQYIVFPKYGKVEIKREERFGGNANFNNIEEMKIAYIKGDLFPLDLKNNLTIYINELLDPVRKHFAENSEAKKLQEEVEGFVVTR